ncbi:MAG: hypothetical protein EOP83_00300 [Verrucomicrobiaceae bacterium]|nr:MAG: hypothetical protein EOP83_00300 [Verrucomicrobiaceae bacterium]
MKKKRLIPVPFNLMPGSWGLSGKAYDEAEAHYYYEGEALERKLVHIRVSPGTEREKRLLAIDLAYKKITPYEYDCRILEMDGLGTDTLAILENEYKHGRKTDHEYLEGKIRATLKGKERDKALIELRMNDGEIDQYDANKQMLMLEDESQERAIALLDLDLLHEKIKKREYDKAVATLREEPWVGVIDDGFDLNQGVNGLYFELDWNEHWITYLRLNGYGGNTQDQIIEAWFADVCRTYVAESNGDSEFQPRPGRVINRFDGGNGSAHYT